MKRTTLLRNLIPALIVALVLGSSFVLTAGAKGNNHDKGDQCGYGYGQSDNDESDNQGNDKNQQTTNKNAKGGPNDRECNEDESEQGDTSGGGGSDNDRGGGRDGGGGGDGGSRENARGVR